MKTATQITRRSTRYEEHNPRPPAMRDRPERPAAATQVKGGAGGGLANS